MGASDLLRVTGLNSGLDTESIISAYTSKANLRLNKAKGSLTKNKWTQDAWKSMNSKIMSFYSGTLSKNRLSNAYTKKKTTTSNSALSVIPGAGATDGVQTAKIVKTANAAYLTSDVLKYTEEGESKVLGADDNLVEKLGITAGSKFSFKTKTGEEKVIQIGGEDAGDGATVVNSMKGLADALKSAGVNANYDEANGRMFISAKTSGEKSDFAFSSVGAAFGSLDSTTAATLGKLGLTKESGASKVDGSNAKLILNNAEFTSENNTFSINGSTYTINSMPANPNEEISVTTGTDYDAVYDVIKDMIKEYNSIINEMSKAYGADPARKYDPLTDEQKEEMTDKEIEEWETKIKDGLLSGNSQLYDVRQAMIDVTLQGFDTDKDGNALFGLDKNGDPIKMYLADFGIATGGYFDTEENERYALHIDGNPDDESTAGKEDKLKSMIASDPEKVTKFFQKFSDTMYNALFKQMSGNSNLSSIYKVYNDKQLSKEESDWETKIKDIEQEISDIEDKWYDKFTTMEKALANMNSNQSAVSSMLGMR